MLTSIPEACESSKTLSSGAKRPSFRYLLSATKCVVDAVLPSSSMVITTCYGAEPKPSDNTSVPFLIARAEAGATMEWIDGNIGSKVTMKYPAVWMTGEHAKGEVLSVAFAGEGQHQDTGAKMLHLAPNTSSNIVSKSVARGGGRASYRGLVQVNKGAHGSRSSVKCDALLVDTISRSDTYPYVDIREDDVTMGHEATVSKVSEDQLFYLMSRGLTEDEAMAMVVRGFVEPIAKELPMEYALELNRLIELQMEGAVG